MIKKITIATFKDGDYAGQYDWQGGLPLTVGETIKVMLDGEELSYKLIDKTTNLTVSGDEQLATISYWFEYRAKKTNSKNNLSLKTS